MSIENLIGVIVGVQVFLYVFLLKIPLKKLHMQIASKKDTERARQAKFRHLNATFILWVFFLSVSIYYIICLLLEIHHKLCCSFKSVAIALTLYAIYEQLFGETE